MRIGIDLMGSDSSPQVLFEGVLLAAKQLDLSHSLIVFATSSIISSLSHFDLPKHSSRIEFHSVMDEITMDDHPLHVVRQKKDSSLVQGITHLKKGLLDAFVSAGNTGALITCSTVLLSKLPGIHRPALLAILPSERGFVVMIDVGGNVSCKAQHLIQFAQMGAAYQRARGIVDPKIGLLNIGSEALKGTSELRLAYQKMQTLSEQFPESFHFKGNIEAKEI